METEKSRAFLRSDRKAQLVELWTIALEVLGVGATMRGAIIASLVFARRVRSDCFGGLYRQYCEDRFGVS